MKRSGKKNEQTKALQRPEPKPADPNGLESLKGQMSAAPKKRKGNAIQVGMDKSEKQLADELLAEMDKAAGVPLHVAARLVSQISNAMVWPALEADDDRRSLETVTTLAEYKPQSIMEAALAVQMTATHEASLAFLWRTLLGDQPPDIVDRNVNRATRLMKLHLEQIEAMLKLKGKAGQQNVTVEHVHVHEGGQAIVGAVCTPKGEGDGGK